MQYSLQQAQQQQQQQQQQQSMQVDIENKSQKQNKNQTKQQQQQPQQQQPTVSAPNVISISSSLYKEGAMVDNTLQASQPSYFPQLNGSHSMLLTQPTNTHKRKECTNDVLAASDLCSHVTPSASDPVSASSAPLFSSVFPFSSASSSAFTPHFTPGTSRFSSSSSVASRPHKRVKTEADVAEMKEAMVKEHTMVIQGRNEDMQERKASDEKESEHHSSVMQTASAALFSNDHLVSLPTSATSSVPSFPSLPRPSYAQIASSTRPIHPSVRPVASPSTVAPSFVVNLTNVKLSPREIKLLHINHKITEPSVFVRGLLVREINAGINKTAKGLAPPAVVSTASVFVPEDYCMKVRLMKAKDMSQMLRVHCRFLPSPSAAEVSREFRVGLEKAHVKVTEDYEQMFSYAITHLQSENSDPYKGQELVSMVERHVPSAVGNCVMHRNAYQVWQKELFVTCSRSDAPRLFQFASDTNELLRANRWNEWQIKMRIPNEHLCCTNCWTADSHHRSNCTKAAVCGQCGQPGKHGGVGQKCVQKPKCVMCSTSGHASMGCNKFFKAKWEIVTAPPAPTRAARRLSSLPARPSLPSLPAPRPLAPHAVTSSTVNNKQANHSDKQILKRTQPSTAAQHDDVNKQVIVTSSSTNKSTQPVTSSPSSDPTASHIAGIPVHRTEFDYFSHLLPVDEIPVIDDEYGSDAEMKDEKKNETAVCEPMCQSAMVIHQSRLRM